MWLEQPVAAANLLHKYIFENVPAVQLDFQLDPENLKLVRWLQQQVTAANQVNKEVSENIPVVPTEFQLDPANLNVSNHK